ncbi:hypothetical protein CBER1_11842 [Cercospora berteroae]|uniref:Reverse transcriptase domain-containing protein n=1 Tax=Cercospora berteroae TaxID=357750 RepID=A0A2S6C0H7_9PEZI|nr:hypothetical protein CBER1_11842 [Cercospora berteroae]
MWRLAKWARTSAYTPPPLPYFPTITDRNGRHTTNEAKANALADHFFPPPIPADLNDIGHHIYPPELDIPQEVTPGDVAAVLKRLPPDKAPGPDGIPNRFLRECRGILARPLAALFQECLKRAYHPTPFRHANTVVLRKPGKPTYD